MRMRTASNPTSRVLGAVAMLVAVALLVACAQTRQVKVEREGFLSNAEWSMMKKVDDSDGAALRFVNPNVDFSRYNAVYVESVSFWRSTETAKLDPETSQMLSEYFYAALVREIGKVANVAYAPGPGVARLRVAFLDAKGANVSGRVVTTVAPQLRILTAAGGMATDTAATVGEIGMAAKLTDSMTDQVLATAADRRLGQKTFSGMTDKWSDAKGAIDLWAMDFAQHWQQFVGGTRR